jgi:hypothetical protein
MASLEFPSLPWPAGGETGGPASLAGREEITAHCIASLEALERAAPAWDDLWRRSDRSSPLLRADRLAAWCRRFAPGARFRAVVVGDGDALIAALPIVGSRLPFVGQGPNNHWSATGDLMVDASAEPGSWTGPLLAGLRRLPWACIVYRACPCEAPAWRHLASEAGRHGLLFRSRATDACGILRLDARMLKDGPGGSRNHRRNVGKAVRRLEAAGGGAFKVHEPAHPDEVDRLMGIGFTIEDTGWKGRGASSVLRTPGMRDYFIDESRSLAARGNLLLFFLEYLEKPIAFQYAFRGKDAVILSKTGYDEEFARLSPGHVMTLDMVKHLAARGAAEVEFGPMTEATAHWVDGSYPTGTVVLARKDLLGRAVFSIADRLLAWKARRRKSPPPPLGGLRRATGGAEKPSRAPGIAPGSGARGD